MFDPAYSTYAYSVDTVLKEFVLHLKHTFGDAVQYLGTTTDPAESSLNIRDIDIIIVFSKINESHVNYIWKIINKLYAKFHITFDARVYSSDQLSSLPIINKHLLKNFLNDQLGTNPFLEFYAAKSSLEPACLKRIKEQQSIIISYLPRIVTSSDQLRLIAQSVYDAIRAYLVLIDHPIASKEKALSFFCDNFPDFSEAEAIYRGYLNPDEIVNVGEFIIDSLGLVKHLFYKAEKKQFSEELLLVNTPSSELPHPRDEYLNFDLNMPLGLVCLATYLEREGIKVEILDSYAENLGVYSTIDRIMEKPNIPRVIGFNASSPNIHIVHKIAKYIKRINKDTVIICGGPHASLAPEHTLSKSNIDYVIVGEGEKPLYQLLTNIIDKKDKKIKNQIPGVLYSKSNRLLGVKEHELMDLSQLPIPKYDLLPLERYFAIKKRIYIHTSRGCAFRCIFCSVPRCWGYRVRHISMNIIIEQIKDIIERINPDEIQIVDDNFSHNNGKIIKNFCNDIRDNNIKIKWKCQARADQLDREIVEKMARFGCFEIDIGIESGNNEIQKVIKKNLNLKKNMEVIKYIKENNIYSKAFFMLGFPSETNDQIKDTINYSIQCKNYGLDDIAFFPVMPFPGTDIAEETGMLVYQGAIVDTVRIYDKSFASKRLRKYSAKPEISLNERFTPDQLRLLVRFAYQRFDYSREVEDLESEYEWFVKSEEQEKYAV